MELTLTLVNRRQFERGQVLVVPRRHAPTLFDLTEREADAITRATRRVAEAIVEAFHPDGMTLYQNNGVASRQEVPHFHMHVVPRWKDGSWGMGPPHIAALQTSDSDVLRQVEVTLREQGRIAGQIRSKLR